jgi:hypothetical protein
MKIRKLKIVAVVIFCLAVMGASMPGQTAKPALPANPPAGKAAPAARPVPSAPEAKPADVPLTDPEKTAMELNQQKVENLQLRIQLLQQQIGQQQKQLADETAALTDKFAKAHGLDPAKYQFIPGSGVFRPITAKK